MRKKIISITLFLLVTNTSMVCGSNEVLLKSRSFVPERGIRADTRAVIEAIPGKAHVLIQLEHIPTIAERKEFEAKGIKLLSYIPNKAWFASIASDKASHIAALSNVRAISEILPEDRISQHIIAGEFFEKRVKEGKLDLIVEFFKDVSLEEAELVIGNHKGRIVGSVSRLNAFVVTVEKEECINLAFEEKVKWVEQELPLEELNDGIRTAIGVDIVQAPPYNLDGNDIDVLVYDGGLVDDTHDDFGSRVIFREESGSTEDHLTHVAGTVGGDGSRSEEEGGTPLQWRGMAPAVDIISYYFNCPGPGICLYDDSGCMADMESNFEQGITTYGADICTASVGFPTCYLEISCEYEGDYSPHAQLIDTIIYDESIPITWAAGNERGPVCPCWRRCGDYGTISPTSTGKNAIVVGAINSNDDSMTSFSSWGPTDDGRIKPDVTAPGCENELYRDDEDPDKTIWSTEKDTDGYRGMCGTSMATPAVAGSAALMLEEWRNIHDGNEPLPSTIKAILAHTAKPLGRKGPDYCYGYGRIDVKEAIDLIDEPTKIFEDSIVDQNDTDHYDINVPEGQGELVVTLVWDDYPGDPAAAKALVNDLDLIVKDPSQKRHYPWTLDPDTPWITARRNQPDNINNVEQVCVYYPDNGTWTVEITGPTVPEPVQKYSLVYSFNLIPQHTDKFHVKDSLGESVAMFDDAGDLFLKGTLYQNSNHPPTGHDEFRVQDVNSVDVAIIDASNGKMYIKGTLKENWQDPSPGKDEFIIEISDDGPVGYINDLGDLYLKGKLYENWIP